MVVKRRKERNECDGNLARPSDASKDKTKAPAVKQADFAGAAHHMVEETSCRESFSAATIEKVTEVNITLADSEVIQRSNENQY